MKFVAILTLVLVLFSPSLFSSGRVTTNLNGIWDFEQTEDAFPPQKFTRTIPVPGFVHLAHPPIDQYENLYAKSKNAEFKTDHKVLDLQYDPKYNWYRKIINVPQALDGQRTHGGLRR